MVYNQKTKLDAFIWIPESIGNMEYYTTEIMYISRSVILNKIVSHNWIPTESIKLLVSI
jgi:hypothetical protein